MATVLQLLLKRNVLRRIARWIVTLLILGGVGLSATWIYLRYSIATVIVTDVVEGPVVQAFYATGTLLPHREYSVKANVEGTLVGVLVDKGSPVTKGQPLARVYVEEFSLKRTQAEAELELKQQLADPKTSPTLLEFDANIRVGEKQFEIAKREYDRLTQLREAKGRTISEVDKAEEAVKTTFNNIEALKSAKATRMLEFARDVKTTQAQLDIAKWNISQQAIASPIDGVVLDWPTSTGTRVQVNDLIMTVADVRYDQLVMRTQVDEEDKIRVRLDQTVHITLYSYPDRVFEGRVKQVYPKADPTRRTFEVDVALAAPDAGFSAGMTGELAFVVEQKDRAIVIPSQSVQAGEVWIVRDNKLEKAEVKLGLRSIQRTEVIAGLAPGEQVMISAIGNMQVEQEVRTTKLDPHTAAGLNIPKEQSAAQFKGLK